MSESLSELAVRFHLRARREVSRRIARRPYLLRLSRPVISFSFDDVPLNAATTASEILKEFGITGTYYVSLGLAGTVAPTGRIAGHDVLQNLTCQGHELGCHTFDHCHAWNTDARSFGESLDRNQKELNRLLPGTRFEAMSYPISFPSPGVKRAAGRRFAVCRGGGQDFNSGIVDRNFLKGFFLEKSRQRPGAVKELIARACAANGWLIFVTHDVSDQPTPYGCTRDFFEEIAKCAINSGADVLPVMQAWKLICAAGEPAAAS